MVPPRNNPKTTTAYKQQFANRESEKKPQKLLVTKQTAPLFRSESNYNWLDSLGHECIVDNWSSRNDLINK